MLSPAEKRLCLLRRVLAVFTALLLSSTWRLWIEPPALLNPQIPWIDWFCTAPPWLDLAALGLLGIGIFSMLGGTSALRTTRWSALLYLLGMSTLVACDQHRLQPWVCQFLSLGVILMLAPNAIGLRCWRWLVCAIYIWSAWSKVDFSFVQSHGQMLLNGLTESLHIDTALWSENRRQVVAASFPAGEMLVGLLLLFRRTRFAGLVLSIGMHLLLIWTLAVGLKHEAGVLVWNAFFIVQNVLLFRDPAMATAQNASPGRRSLPELVALTFTTLVILHPLGTAWGYCDHWPAWEVYASRPEQVRILLRRDVADQLPPELRMHLRESTPFDESVPLNLDNWAYRGRRCPIYPQARYRLALALALLDGQIPQDGVQVQVLSSPQRWNGQRQQTMLSGLDALRSACERFTINTRPRTVGPPPAAPGD
ncbi:MauE/DoxX family redox-associated membrane protein [Planctomicrobium sp. SH664]|uniref:MauE/DoxX family redox-associated membrane protein n=1 Tax=Planctomicrobium sp. SH664 TaxID=3448125 RepID=UPI003F5B2C35